MPKLPIRRTVLNVALISGGLLSFYSSSAQDLANGTIELTASASYNRDGVGREEVDEDVTFDTGATQNVTWSLPAGTLQGKYVTSEPYQFTTQAEGSVSFDGEIFTATASASIQLNGDARYTTLQRGDDIPVVQAKLRNFGLTDFITLYSSDPSHWGQQVLADVSVDVTAALSSSLENSAQPGSLAQASYSTLGGTTDGSGYVQHETPDGELISKSVGDFNLATPKTVTRQNIPMWIASGLGLPPQVGGNRVGAGANIETTARIAADSGGAASANATVTLRNPRIGNVRLASDGTAIADELLTSIARSGYDWLGNGEPEVGPIEGQHWDNPNGGVFGVAENWFDTNANGEADDVPEAEDTAVFDLPSSYSITLAQNRTVDKLIVSGDDTNITFNPDGKVLTIEDDLIVGARFEDNATLNISGAEIRVADSTILGDQGNGTLNITHSDALSTDKLIVGGANSSVLVSSSTVNGSDTLLEIASELDLRVGSLTVESTATTGLDLNAQLSFGSIDQENSSMLMHPGTSALFRNGGKSISQIMDLVVGYLSNSNVQPGAATAILTVDGGIETGESTLSWQPSEFTGIVGSMKIGQNSPGLVHVRNGGRFGFPISNIDDGAEESLAIDGSASGELLVEGVSPTGDPSIASFDSLRIGSYDAESPTSATIRNGGRLELGKAEVYGTSGGLFVEGSNSGVVSEIVIAQSLETLNGTIEATDGGQITFLEKLQVETQERGHIRIEGGSSIVGPIEPLENDESFLNLFTVSNTDHTALTISGVDSQGNSSRLEIQGEGDQASIIGNGLVDSGIVIASVQAGGLLNLPERPLAIGAGAPGKLVVQGVDAASGNRSRVVTDLLLASPEAVDRIFTSSIQIQDGGLVHSRRGELDIGSDTLIEGTFGATVSELRIEEDLILGDGDSESQNQGTITLIGGQVNVGQNLTVKPQGWIFGNGTLSAPVGGVSNQGYIAPGFSPGSLHIEGDFTQEASGTLEMEIFGPNPEDQDRITVSGNATLAGTLLIVFGGHEPSANDQYPLLEVTGALVEQDLAMEFAGLQPGFEARCEVIDGQLTLIAETDGQALVNDEPFTIPTNQIDASGNIGFRFYGFAGMTYTFETSIDLETWIPIATEEGENSLIDFRYGTNGAEQRFYRFTITANGE